MSHHHDENETPDGGFFMDMTRISGRRGVLAALGLGGVSLLAACAAMAQGGPPPGGEGGPGAPPPANDPQPDQIGTGADGETCTLPTSETNGPYPADGSNVREGQTVNALTQNGILRQDITASFGAYDGAVEGIPFDLEVQLVALDGCTPLAGKAFYIWQCDAAGRYSLYTVPGANWLRGMQISDANGKVRFSTILPGCYEGRWPHFHFEVFTDASSAVNGRDSLLISQFALPETGLAAIYAGDSRYADSVGPFSRVTLDDDNIFGDNTVAQMAAMTPTVTGGAAGMSATAKIAIVV